MKKSFFNTALIKYLLFDSLSFAYISALLLSLVLKSSSYFEEEFLISHMTEILWIILALLFMGLVQIKIFKFFGHQTLGEIIFYNLKKNKEQRNCPLLTTAWGWQLLTTLLLTFLAGLWLTDMSWRELIDYDGFIGAKRLFAGLTSPNLAILPIAILKIIETVFIAFMATALAIPIAFFLAFFCAKNIMTHPFAFLIYALLRTYLNIIRAVEPLIWAIIFSVWVGIGPFAGMLALMLHSISSLTKQYSEIIESVSEGPIEAVRSTGANTIQTLWFAIVPQVTMPYVAFSIYRWDINVRMATVIGLVGGGGIGTLLIKYQGQALWPEVGCIILVIAVVVWAMDAASAYLREALK